MLLLLLHRRLLVHTVARLSVYFPEDTLRFPVLRLLVTACKTLLERWIEFREASRRQVCEGVDASVLVSWISASMRGKRERERERETLLLISFCLRFFLETESRVSLPVTHRTLALAHPLLSNNSI